MQMNPYLVFDGNCAEAMQFYAGVLNGTLDLMRFGDSPMADHAPPEFAQQIIHARLLFDGGVLMASDAINGPPYAGKHGFSVTLTLTTAAEAEAAFAALAEGGSIKMALEKTFWADAFGMLVDRYGTPWMVNGGMQAY